MKKLFIRNPLLLPIIILLFLACSKEPVIIKTAIEIPVERQKEIPLEGQLGFIKDSLGNELARFHYLGNNQLEYIELNTPDGNLISKTFYKYDEYNRIIEIETIRNLSSAVFAENCGPTPHKTLINYTYSDDGSINSIISNQDLRSTDYRQLQTIIFSKNSFGQIDSMLINFTISDISRYEKYIYNSTGELTESGLYMLDVDEYKFITKNQFVYDDYKNPFSRLFIQDNSSIKNGSLVYSPIEYTHNIISKTSLYYSEMYPEGKSNETKTCYEYNAKGYPIKINNRCNKEFYVIEYIEE